MLLLHHTDHMCQSMGQGVGGELMYPIDHSTYSTESERQAIESENLLAIRLKDTGQ